MLVDLARLYDESAQPAAAIAVLQEALLVEPLHERAHRDLMRIYALTGRRQHALAQFHLLRESLRREFEDEPDDETRRLYQDILTRRFGAADALEPADHIVIMKAAQRAEPNLTRIVKEVLRRL